MNIVTLKPIGTVRSTRREAIDDNWDSVESYIELTDLYTKESLEGINDFSHIEVVFYMDQVDPKKIETTARHPRHNTNWPRVGIFAQRAKNRPNQIATTICRLLKIDGTKIYLEGLDAIDGSPVLDIKPWVKEFGPRGTVFQPQWISDLMQKYWKS